jgi:hypothetical protein
VLVAAACAGEERGSAVPTVNSGSSSVVTKGTLAGAAAVGKSERTAATASPAPRLPGGAERVAVANRSAARGRSLAPTGAAASSPPATPETAMPATPIERAKHAVALALDRYQQVTDYTCTFYKRERIYGRLTPLHIMTMKVRTKPHSIYLKFRQPAAGREAIYVSGRNDGKLQAHDVGLNRLLAGTLELIPTSARAMEDCRHPITEAGIGPLLETLKRRWDIELKPDTSVVRHRDDMVVGAIRCSMIESTHPERRPEFLFHQVRVFIDQATGLPIRFEAYDWPKRPGAAPELAEEYTYMDLKLNVGLSELDFDVSNRAYSFGRF